MHTLNRNLWRAMGCFLIANTLGIGIVGAQSAPIAASPPRKADPRFTVQGGNVDIRKLDVSVVVGPIQGCPVLLVTGCSSSTGGLFSRVLGGVLRERQLTAVNPLLDASIRYDR